MSRCATNHPLHLLDDFLSSLSPLADVNEIAHDDETPTRRQDLVLRVADELLGYDHRGGGRGGTLLENALALLDDNRGRSPSQVVVGDDGPAATIRRIRAKRSGREAILFRKQHGSTTKIVPSSTAELPSGKTMRDDYYLCLVPRLDRRGFGSIDCGAGIRGSAHCTCRSFFQNIITGGGHGGRRHCHQMPLSSSLNTVVTCKHVLAAKLMPHVLLSGSDGNFLDDVEIVDDRLFARLLMRASIG
ncbi:hypothetical protein ACHAXH_009955 [Discostella pseudostelligera]